MTFCIFVVHLRDDKTCKQAFHSIGRDGGWWWYEYDAMVSFGIERCGRNAWERIWLSQKGVRGLTQMHLNRETDCG